MEDMRKSDGGLQTDDGVPVKEVAQEKAENTENKGSDIRPLLQLAQTKIWEFLGTVSTPTKQFSNSQTLKRPVTRSLTRKKTTIVQQRKAKNAPSSSNKHKQPEKINSATIGGSVSKSEKKKSSRTEPHKLHFSKRNNADETRKVTDSSKKEDHMESSSGLKNGVGGLCGSPLKNGPSESGTPEIVTAQDTECLFLQTKRCRPSEAGTPEIVTDQDPECLFRQTKRCRPSEAGTPKIVTAEDPEIPSLFDVVLERLIKVKSGAKEECAEILKFNARDMQLQFQNAESQIQKDVRKLTGMGETKMRHLEAIMQEKQGKLEDICERFRNEVKVHLQNCINTIEGELQQTEFKDMIDNQKASHHKLLIQVGQAIKTGLYDAHKRIYCSKVGKAKYA